MNLARIIASLGALALGTAMGICGALALLLSDRDGGVNEVFGIAHGAAYLLPTAGLAIAVTLLPTVLLARHSATLGKLAGLSSVWVLAVLVVLAGLLAASWQFAALGLVIGVAGSIMTVLTVRNSR